MNVVVVVFSGRRDRMRILMRYLRRDLRKHGGVVDKIVFALWQYTAKVRAHHTRGLTFASLQCSMLSIVMP